MDDDAPLRPAKRLTTETGQRLADELLGQGPLDWLRSALGEQA
ncbi:hypothetical protein AB0F11_11050 [Streptomyces sp. NPDC032472]